MKGYKISTQGMCKNVSIKVGETYIHEGSVKPRVAGFHFCTSIDELLSFYDYKNGTSVIFEVEATGTIECDGALSVASELSVTRIVNPAEYNNLFTKYQFDTSFNIVKKGHCTMEYDKNNRMVKRTYLDGNFDRWEYDTKGNVIKFEYSMGYWFTQEFDENNKLIKHVASNGKNFNARG